VAGGDGGNGDVVLQQRGRQRRPVAAALAASWRWPGGDGGVASLLRQQ
jgi:hypothetical protein